MADESEFIYEIYEFHPGDTPRGMLYYKLNELTGEQQHRLNAHNLNIIRNNQKYLHDHPEVKIITSMLLKAVMKERPKYHLHKFLLKYLLESWADIKKLVDIAIAERTKKEAIQRQRLATIAYLKQLYEEEGFEEADEYNEFQFHQMLHSKNHHRQSRHNVKTICKSVVHGIVDNMELKEKHRVQIRVSDESDDSDFQLDIKDTDSIDDTEED